MSSGDKGSGERDSGKKSRWQCLWRWPRTWWLLGVPLGGILTFILGMAVWAGFNTALHANTSVKFCVSCHEMQINFDEYAKTIHYQNPMGVRAKCSNCHDSPTFWPLFKDKLRATFVEIPNHFLGTLDTPAKFEAHRPEMAKQVWARMKANNSANCRSCHSYAAMQTSAQSHSAAVKHSLRWREKTGDTCIDCHFGIAHQLPMGLTPAVLDTNKKGS